MPRTAQNLGRSVGGGAKSKTNKTNKPQYKKRPSPPPLRNDYDDRYKFKLNLNRPAIKNKTDQILHDNHRCVICHKVYSNLSNNFPVSYSDLYKLNNARLPLCKSCLNKLFEQMYQSLGDEYAAMRRVCQLFDMYYCDALVDTAMLYGKPNKRMDCYISKLGLKAYANKTYGDTLIEESEIAINSTEDINCLNLDKEELEIAESFVQFWGFGFTADEYRYLQEQYDDWKSRYEITSKALESLVQKLCMMDLQILRAMQKGADTTKLYNEYNKALNSAHLQPKQTNDSSLADTNTFGTLIKKWENEKPIPEPDPDFQDVDGVRYYVSVWFLGHLCKMIGIKNTWSALYEQEVKKFTVSQPEYNENDDVDFDDIFKGYIVDE